jgi:alkylation response protein AidB-like acyl-CoA dehydrogenase
VDFQDTPEEAAFRAEARSWLKSNATALAPDASQSRPRWRDPSPEGQAAHVTACRRWQATLYEGGWAGITWPAAYGGRGGTPMQQMIFNQEQAGFEVSTGALTIGLAMVGPTLIAWGTEDQQARFLDPMLRGEEMWCQLFSEPGAGSDLAGLITRADRDRDTWVVNGQKVWTSMAQHSDWGILLARTDSSVPKHQGLSYFLVDMKSPGVEVSPLRQIDGVAHFNEVFLTDVRIPANQAVGDSGNGWRVAQTTLQSERVAIGSGDGLRFDHLRSLLAGTGSEQSVRYRQQVVAAFIRFELLRYLGLRVQTAISQGGPPGSESSVMKLAFSQHIAALTDLVVGLEGAAGMLVGDTAPDGGLWQQHFLSQWSIRIGGGTDQIQRNIISERVLGLPREPTPEQSVSGQAGRS